MNERIEQLRTMGCDTALALERMANDEEFYIECLGEALENPGFDGLAEALSAGDVSAAFDCAHALKGVLGSVGLTPMFQKASQIVEPLRAGSCTCLEGELSELLEMRREFFKVVS